MGVKWTFSLLIGILLQSNLGNVSGYIHGPSGPVASGFISAPHTHPLDPLTSNEIHETTSIIRATLQANQMQGNWVFKDIYLREPEKHLLLPYFLNDMDAPSNSPQIPRKSFTILVEQRSNTLVEVVINLNEKRVESWTGLPPGTMSYFAMDEKREAAKAALADPRIQERCRQMGWTNMSLVVPSSWSVPLRDRPELVAGKRLIFMLFWGKLFELDNKNAHPFDFVAYVDASDNRVLAIDNIPTHDSYDTQDRRGNVCPKGTANYDPATLSSHFHRRDLNPIRFSQPGGASFKVRGNEITWQKFKFRIGFNAKEGLSIHQVSYRDRNGYYPLFYRMSMGELFVPYADARPPFHMKYPYDEGEFNMYPSTNMESTKLCEGGGVAAYFSFHYHNSQGEIFNVPNAVCVYEEDQGILWAHWAERYVQARSQRLTVTTMANKGNYDYKFAWHFYQDASVEFSTQLFGAVVTHMMAEGETRSQGFGSIMAPGVQAPYHQHFIALRADMDIGGNLNSVSTVDVVPLPDPVGSPRNPFGNGFTLQEELLRTPSQARQNVQPQTARSWMVKNPQMINPVSKRPMGWKLVPYNTPHHFTKMDSPLHPRLAWTDYNLWVTKYRDWQIHPGGLYVNASGLPQWVAENPNEDISHEDVVLWYIYGLPHIPRLEDYPIMPVETTTVAFKPTNFFTENPAIDVVPHAADISVFNVLKK